MGVVVRGGVLDTHTHLGAAQHNGSIVLPAAELLCCRGQGNVTLLFLKVTVHSEVKQTYIYIYIFNIHT